MRLSVLPEAEGEAIEAALWYEERQPLLGEEFLAALGDGFARIQQGPDSLPVLESYSGPHCIRRLLLRRFPFAIVLLCRPREVLVVANAHTRRRPLYWLSRIT